MVCSRFLQATCRLGCCYKVSLLAPCHISLQVKGLCLQEKLTMQDTVTSWPLGLVQQKGAHFEVCAFDACLHHQMLVTLGVVFQCSMGVDIMCVAAAVHCSCPGQRSLTGRPLLYKLVASGRNIRGFTCSACCVTIMYTLL